MSRLLRLLENGRIDPTLLTTRRFSFAQVELKWLPISESAFLLWVLAALFGVWLLVGYLLGLI